METVTNETAAVQGTAAVISDEAKIAKLTADVAKRERVLAILQGLPDEDRSADSEASELKAIKSMKSEITKLQFKGVHDSIVEQSANIAVALREAIDSATELQSEQVAVIQISIFGDKTAEGGNGYKVDFRLRDNSIAAVSTKADGEAGEKSEGAAKGKPVVYKGMTYTSAAKAMQALYAEQGKQFPTTSKNWLAHIKINNEKEGWGMTYADGTLIVKD